MKRETKTMLRLLVVYPLIFVIYSFLSLGITVLTDSMGIKLFASEGTEILFVLGSSILLTVLTVGVIEWMRIKTPLDEKTVYDKISFAFPLFFACLFGTIFIDEGTWVGCLGGVIGAIVGFVFAKLFSKLFCILHMRRPSVKKETERLTDIETKKQAVEFYNDCKENGVYNFASQKDQQRAQLILSRYPLLSPDVPVQHYIDMAKESISVNNKAEHNAKLAKIRQEEIQEAEESIKYAEFFGRDKKIAILTDELNECLDTIKSIEAVSYALMCGSQMDTIPEKDWATVGGLVSGFAGGATGLAAASNIQAQNAQIHAQNEQIKAENKVRMKQSFLFGEKMKKDLNLDSYKRKAEKLKEEIEKAQIKLVSEKKAAEVFKNIRFAKGEMNFTDTGAIRISVQVSCKNPVKIFDDSTYGYIDGTIRAEVFQERTKIGETLLVLPLHGARYSESGSGQLLNGIVIGNAVRGEKYTVKYSPYKLWEIEV